VSSLNGSSAQKEELAFAWWNTSLSPNVKGRADDDDLSHAVRAVDELIAEGVVLVGFCEISRKDVEHLSKHSSLATFGFSQAEQSVSGVSTFDTCIAYDPARLSLLHESVVVVPDGGGHLRVGQRFVLEPSAGGEPIHVIISHWPSRRTLAAGATERTTYGYVLRGVVDTLLAADAEAQIVLMGDYNDEPFNASIMEALKATRDRDRSKTRTDLLYNPFWRHLASFEHDVNGPCSDQGTYYYKSGKMTRWHTFDQMIFSSSLLTGAKEWQLDEGRTRAYSPSWLDDLLKKSASIFDHRPIVGRMQRT